MSCFSPLFLDPKPAVLVVLRHTLDPESIVPDSSSVVNRENTIAVDDVVHEDQGLLPCTQDDESPALDTNLIQSSVLAALLTFAKNVQFKSVDKIKVLLLTSFFLI